MSSTVKNVAPADRWAGLVGASFVTAGDDEAAAAEPVAPDALDVATDMAARASIRVDRPRNFARWTGPKLVSDKTPPAALDLVR